MWEGNTPCSALSGCSCCSICAKRSNGSVVPRPQVRSANAELEDCRHQLADMEAIVADLEGSARDLSDELAATVAERDRLGSRAAAAEGERAEVLKVCNCALFGLICMAWRCMGTQSARYCCCGVPEAAVVRMQLEHPMCLCGSRFVI